MSALDHVGRRVRGAVAPEGPDGDSGEQRDGDADEGRAGPGDGEPETRGHRPGPQVAEPGAAGDDHGEHSLQPPAQLVRGVGLQDGLPVDDDNGL